MWAFLWLSDIEKLEDWVERANRDPPGVTRYAFEGIERSSRIAQIWKQRDHANSAASTPRPSTPQPSTPLSTPRSSLAGGRKRKHDDEQTADEAMLKNRSKKVAALCRQRDQGSCVITKAGDIDVAHIYHFSMRGYRDSDSQTEFNIWQTLRLFWSDDRVRNWHDAIFPEGNFVEVCHNLMCLNPLAHRYHENGYFALKPIGLEDEDKCLKVRFFWLKQSKSLPMNVGIFGAPLLEGSDQGPNKAKLYNHETDDKICSGDELCLETHDPKKFPLPSLELLDMQWILNRLVAIRGAAEADDDGYDDDGDDEDDQIALRREQDRYMVDEWRCGVENLSNSCEVEESSTKGSQPPSSPPSSPLAPPSSSGLPKRSIWSHLATAQGTAEGTAETNNPDLII